ncbi:hypothetical protein [Streptococcus pneumoniae]|nr:hypothetical protein [Streptococcus pneumoniae]MTV47161.1 hypothetical protein [Streptococcus pneumoniae]
MTRLDFIELVKNMGGDAIVADAIGCVFMLYANKCGYVVKIKQINKVML